MTDEDALIRAIIAAPDDNAPRLVYADWFDEHGDPQRAYLIRAQIAGKWLGHKPRGLRMMFPYVNVSTPIRVERDKPIEPSVSPGRGVFVRRGFIDEVRVVWKTWKRIGPAIVAHNPVRYVGIWNVGIESSRDGEVPKVDVLWIWEGLPPDLRQIVPEEWIASNPMSPAHWRTQLSDVVIALARNNFVPPAKLPTWGRRASG